MARILVVEDDETIRDLLKEALSLWGHETVCVENGELGLNTFFTDTFSFIISDVRMPVMDGLTMIEHIRKKDPFVPIIIITGYPSFDSAVASLDKGADYYLVKPVNLNDLKAKVSKCLQKKEVQIRLQRLGRINRILVILLPVCVLLGFLLARML